MNPPPTVVDPAELRPRKKWFWIAGIIAAVGIIVGIGGAVGLFVYGATSITPGHRTELDGAGRGSGSVRLTTDHEWAIYATTDTSWYFTCTATSPSGSARVTEPNETLHVTYGGRTWYEIARVKAPADGTYQVRCAPTQDATDTDVQAARFMVGDAPRIGAFFGGLFGGFAVLFGVPFVTVLAAVIIAIVTGVRRGNHRKRLLAQRGGGPRPYGY